MNEQAKTARQVRVAAARESLRKALVHLAKAQQSGQSSAPSQPARGNPQ